MTENQEINCTIVGGKKGHDVEAVAGIVEQLYHSLRWKMIPGCTGRYTCRDHQQVSMKTPLELLNMIGIDESYLQYEFRLPGRADSVIVVPVDDRNHTGIITFRKPNDGGYVHTLNLHSGFRRKLMAIGIRVSDDGIGLDSNTNLEAQSYFKCHVD